VLVIRPTFSAAGRPAVPFAAPHLVGIAGSGMKSLAELLRDLGCRVTGSDRSLPGGHCETNVPADCDALISSSAVPPDNPERTAAAALGIPQFSLVDVLAELMKTRTGVCIAGTHGKSTTTALTAWILQHAGREPSAFIGASIRNQPAGASPRFLHNAREPGASAQRLMKTAQRGGWAGSGELFVAESCEYRRHFLQLTPRHAVILNIEPDHFDTFPDDAALLDGFQQFAARVPPDGTLLISGDCERSPRIAPSRCAVHTFGSREDCNWRFTDVRQTASGTHFTVLHDDRIVTEVETPLFGDHNVHNTLAATALCLRLGLSAAEVRDAVRAFPGIARRFAPIGEWRGVRFFDDYAHHPTAVRVTLETARQRFGGQRVWCVFQPHQLTRTERLLDEFAAALSIADRVLITPVFAAREEASEAGERVSRLLVERARSRIRENSDGSAEFSRIPLRQSASRSCRFCPSLDRILPTLDHGARPGDVVILMGAGDIERIGHELAGRISGNHTGR
jgi:UDP-N-acetylmuramate--alanine ligase